MLWIGLVSQTDRTCQDIFLFVSFVTRLVVDQYKDSLFKHFYFSSCFGFFVWKAVDIGCFPKIVGKLPPNHPFYPRVFHYFHHPFWGFSPYLLGNTHILNWWVAGRVQLGLPLCGSSLGPWLEDADDSIATSRCGASNGWVWRCGSSQVTPLEDERLEHSHEGLEDDFPFHGWFVGSMLIFQGVKVKITPLKFHCKEHSLCRPIVVYLKLCWTSNV